MKHRKKTGQRLPMWHAWCAGCEPQRVSGFHTCKDGRLCDRIDLRLPSLLGTNDLARCEDAQRAISLGSMRASLHVEHHDLPTSAEGFVAALCELHRRIFEEGVGAIAGRLRTVDDPEVTVGGDGDHCLVAMPCEAIPAALFSLFHDIPADLRTQTRDGVLYVCARFLEGFFRVHPFVDGNGRVGRLMVTWLCRTQTRFRFSLFDTRGRRRRRYLRALQYAHKHAAASEHPDRRPTASPLRPLMAWLALYLEEIADDSLSEAAPPDEGTDGDAAPHT